MLAKLLLASTMVLAQIQASPSHKPTTTTTQRQPTGQSQSSQESKTAKKPQKPKVSLRCSPRVSSGTFLAFLKVENPGERFWCPGVVWLIDENGTGSHESDCDPYETVVTETGEPQYWEEPPKEFTLPTGEYRIEAKLVRAGHTIGSDSCTVFVR